MKKNRLPRNILYTDGTVEVVTNDGQVKIILFPQKIQNDGEQTEGFRSVFFVKEYGNWVRGLNVETYRTNTEFIEAISKCPEFSEVLRFLMGKEGLSIFFSVAPSLSSAEP